NAQNRGLAFGEGARQPREVDGLLGAARRVGARIEKQHELFPRVIGQRNSVAAVAGEAEGGRPCTFDQRRVSGGGRVDFFAHRFFPRRRICGLGLRHRRFRSHRRPRRGSPPAPPLFFFFFWCFCVVFPDSCGG